MIRKKMFRPEFSTATDLRVLQTRKALRDALLGLLKKKSFDKISVREIVAAAGIGYNTFFRHYPDKESMLQDIAAEEIRQLVSCSLPVLDARDTLSACVALCNYVDENRKLWRTLLTGGAAQSLREEYVRVAREVCSTRPRGKDWVPLRPCRDTRDRRDFRAAGLVAGREKTPAGGTRSPSSARNSSFLRE